MKVKVIQTGIKLYSSAVSVMKPSSKEIILDMSKYKPMLKVVWFCCWFVFVLGGFFLNKLNIHNNMQENEDKKFCFELIV